MSKIKIAVACHKLSVLPDNDLLMPVQVGAANAAKRMNGMMHDDEGDNISEKNPQYCELTAQYWAWKNVEADYYGLCHYRRFLCFRNVDAPRNLRGQIEASAITPYNIARFGLEDKEEMRKVIEANDVVCGPLQDVKKLYTPRGNQPTALRHWTAHDRALIMVPDLERMLSILEEVSPHIGAAAREYLNGKVFLGFNCFVMRKSLFQEMCSIEFEVLKRLEAQVDLTHYNQQLSRIYGFMGEIISSAYIYWAEKSKKYKVCHLPLVYFNNTDPVPNYAPVWKLNSIPVFFDFTTTPLFLFAAPLRSFLDNIDSEHFYDIFVAASKTESFVQKEFQELCHDYSNVSLRFLDFDLWRGMLEEEYGQIYYLLPYLPWVLKEYEKIFVFGPRVLFAGSVAPLWDLHKDTKTYACASCDILMQARINDIYRETEENYVSEMLKDPYSYFCTESMLWNMEAMRVAYSEKKLKNFFFNKFDQLRSCKEIINLLCENRTEKIGQEYNTWYMTSDYLKYQLPYAPCGDYLALLKAQKDPVVIVYQLDSPLFEFETPVSRLFWRYVRETVFYEQTISHMEMLKRTAPKADRNVLNKLLPRGKLMRGYISRLFPKGSRRNRFIKRIMHFFHVR